LARDGRVSSRLSRYRGFRSINGSDWQSPGLRVYRSTWPPGPYVVIRGSAFGSVARCSVDCWVSRLAGWLASVSAWLACLPVRGMTRSSPEAVDSADRQRISGKQNLCRAFALQSPGHRCLNVLFGCSRVSRLARLAQAGRGVEFAAALAGKDVVPQVMPLANASSPTAR